MVPDQRTIIVLAALITGMTVTSGLLLLLEPGPVAPLTNLTLQSIDRGPSQPEDKLFDTAQPLPWDAIIIHDSGTMQGSSKTLHEMHERLGRGGLGYHFVIGNGQGADDGDIEVGYRWKRQFAGGYLDEQVAQQWRNAIGVCLVGDADRQAMTETQLRELVWLVQQLQQRFHIDSDRVYVEVGAAGQSRLFPYLWFREQLLSRNLP